MDQIIFLTGDSQWQRSIALAALAIFLLLSVIPDGKTVVWRWREPALLCSIFFLLYAMRWPIMAWPHPINIDEGQFVAAAVKTTVDWVPWRGVDNGTSGPLNSYILAAPALLGVSIDLFSARMVAVTLLAVALGATYCALRWIYGAAPARIAIVAPVLLLSLTTFHDFVHCTSEHFSIYLTTVAMAAAAYLSQSQHSMSRRLVACAISGLCAGSSAFAKLQSLPLAAAVFLAAASAIMIAARDKRIRWRYELTILTVAAGIVSIFMLVTLWLTGELQNAFISYIQMGLVQTQTGTDIGVEFFFSYPSEYADFLGTSIVVALLAAGALYRRTVFTPSSLWLFSSSLLLLLASIFAIHRAHRPFPHYLLFSIVPVTLFLGNWIGLLHRSNLWPRVATFLLPATFLLLLGKSSASVPTYYRAPIPSVPPEIHLLRRYTNPGDRMALWCWKPEYYVYTKTIMATRDPHTQRQQEPSPFQSFFRDRYLRDLTASPPPVFVDGVAPGSFSFADRATHGMESFPDLAAFIHERYSLAEELNGVRIFVLNN